MAVKIFSQNKVNSKPRGQAMVEFAIALPVLLMMLVGIMEVGRLVFMYTLVTNASRDAVRYASAYGRGEDGLLKYKNCAGIKFAARQSAYIVTLTSISVTYDSGPAGSSKGTCDASSGEDADIDVDTGDRVIVTVQATYNPIVSLLPIGSRTFTATSRRTILGVYDLPN